MLTRDHEMKEEEKTWVPGTRLRNSHKERELKLTESFLRLTYSLTFWRLLFLNLGSANNEFVSF